MPILVLSTRNAHKVREIRQILPADFQCLTLDDFPGTPPVVEDAATFEGNAIKKAVALAKFIASAAPQPSTLNPQLFSILADDSGLEVDALNGAPGVLSARFAADSQAAGNSPDAANNAKLLRLLAAVSLEKRTARFRCVLALVKCGAEVAALETPMAFHGVCEGRIAFAPAGDGGFGYDPLFIPTGHDLSFAQLGAEVKNGISHRARALGKLRSFLAS